MSDTPYGFERFVPGTADPDLLRRPLMSLEDCERIEQVELDQRLVVTDFNRRIDLALTASDPGSTAIYFVPDGDVGRTADEITFGALRDNIARTAALLRAVGVGKADAVAVLSPALPALYWALLGAMSAGIVFPINWMMEPAQIGHLIRQGRPKAVIALGPAPGFRIWESLMSVRADLPPDVAIFSLAAPGCVGLARFDLASSIAAHPPVLPESRSGSEVAAYVHSGGTTGAPKIVVLTHRGLSYRHWTMQLGQRLSLGEVHIHDTPMFHVGGLIGRVLSALASGGRLVIPSLLGARDGRYIGNYWQFVEKYKVSRLSAVPTTLATLCKTPPSGQDLSSLKPNFIVGSTALPMAVRDRFEIISGVRVLNTYGMTENTSVVAIDPRDGAVKQGGSGLRVPYTQVRARVEAIRGETRICGPDEIGMLEIKGPGVTPGYLDPAHDEGLWTADGWLISGDMGRVDADGFVFVTGRAKDIIIRGGHNIDPTCIEEPLMQSPEVMLAAAVGKPDAHAGELPIVYVQRVPGSQLSAEDVLHFLEHRIAERAALPKEVIFIDRIPLTDVGKPQKNLLKRDAAERTFRNVLSAALVSVVPFDSMNVQFEEHKTFGYLVSLSLKSDPEIRERVTAIVDESMQPYAIKYVLRWL